ncbi:MAG TPA: sugar ABC transporter substrate-binding protein [Rectinemataceae bacterium]
MKRRVFAALTILILVLALGTTAFAQAKPAKRIKIGFANINERSAFTKMVRNGIEAEAKKRGWDIVSVDNASDGATAVRNADDLITQKIDYMIEFNVDGSVAPVIMEKFNAAKIPVIAVDIPHPGAVYFGADNVKAGTLGGEFAGDWINKNWKGQVDYVVLLAQAMSGATVAPRVHKFPDGLRNKGIKVNDKQIVVLDTSGDVAKMQQMFSDFLMAHPDGKRIAVASMNDLYANGAYSAAEIAGRTDEVVIVSQNAAREFVEALYAKQGKTNWIASIGFFPNRYGEWIFQILDKMVAGQKVEPNYYIGHEAVSWDNIKKYYPLDNLPWANLK